MGYIQDLEKELRAKLPQMDEENLVKFFKDKVWESYRNGMGASKKPSSSKWSGKKTSRFSKRR